MKYRYTFDDRKRENKKKLIFIIISLIIIVLFTGIIFRNSDKSEDIGGF